MLPFRAGVIRLLAGSVLISFSGVFVKWADVGPTVSGFYRCAFGALTLLILVVMRRDTLWRGWVPLLYASAAALFFAADLWAWHRSIFYVGPGLATILGNFQVFLLAAAGVWFFKERVTARFVVSVLLAFIGLGLLVGSDWSELETGYKVGIGLGLLTALVYASYLLTLRTAQRLPRPLTGTANLATVSLMCAIVLGGLALAEGHGLGIPDARSGVVLVAYGVICQAIGWVLIAGGIRSVEAARAGLILLLQPTLTFIWDILFFQRATTGLEALGALLALGAIYLGNTAVSRKSRETRPGSPRDAMR